MLRCVPVCRQSLSATDFYLRFQFGKENIPATHTGRTTPEEEGQEDHEEGMCTKIGCECEIRVESRRAHFLLHPGQIWRLISDQWDELLSRPIPPEGQSVRIYVANAQRLAYIARNHWRIKKKLIAYSDSDSSAQHRAGPFCCP